MLKDPASYIPASKYPVIHQAALDACDALDGLKDGLIDDPSKCHFDPKVLLCKGSDGPACLTAPQVEAAKKIYSPAINPRTGQQLFFSLVPGTELGWGVQATGPDPYANLYDQYRYVVFTVREAKEYLIDRILSQADRDATPLSNVERKMLYFSESGWTLSDMMAISQEFDQVNKGRVRTKDR